MLNNTVRLYRGRYYWTLNGLPADSGTLDGPFEITFKNMGQIFPNNTVVTLLGGTDRGKTVKTEGKNYWMWDDKGNMKTEATGLSHNRFPTGGFEAAIHDGNMDDPTLIGFKGIKSYYFSTRYRLWTIDNKPSGYFGGKYNETFPTDLSAAFTLPADNPEDGYIVYFFKRNKYCKRTKILKSGKDCDEWLLNKDLFGCGQPTKERTGSGNSDSQHVEEQPPVDNPQAGNDEPQPKDSGEANPSGNSSPLPTFTPKPGNDQQKQQDDQQGSATNKVTEQNTEHISASTVPSTTPRGGTSLPMSSSLAITVLAVIQCFRFKFNAF